MKTKKGTDETKMNSKKQKAYSKKYMVHFLIISFILLMLISIGSFITLGYYMSSKSESSINTVGNIYMSAINNHITAHFRTLMELKLEQVEGVVDVVPDDLNTKKELDRELVYRSNVRNFNYLALCSRDGNMEMLDGEKIQLADPDSFYNSLRNNEKKVAVGNDSTGQEVVVFGVSAAYPMKSGETSMSLVAAVPIEYISSMLNADEEKTLIYSHIIRRDGSFIINDVNPKYTNYFDSIYDKYKNGDINKVDAFLSDLKEAMHDGKSFTGVFDANNNLRQVYCTQLPFSEWYLLTILPSGVLNDTIRNLDNSTTIATICVAAGIFLILLLIFYLYYRMTYRQLKALEQARMEALDATKAKSQFLSNMSHDIRTPMNAIVGMTAIASAHIDDKEQVQNCLKKITLSGKHLLGLINDILDMSKIESGKMTLTAEKISLRHIIEGVVGIEQTHIKEKKQSFNVHINNIISEDVYCDSVRLNQVLLNLMSNAVKYTPEGGTVQLSMYQEEAPADKADKYVRTHIIVSDNGIGMSKEFLTRIFDSYSREDVHRVHKTEGAGLGMAITKHIVDAMNGTITVESELNKGTIFHVILDFEKAPTDEVEMTLPNIKTLVLDDDKILCQTAVDALKSMGITADSTLDARVAVEMVKEHFQTDDKYKLILLDWKLNDANGFSVSKEIRSIVGEDTLIILISAYDWSEFEAEAKASGINGFISKPLFKSTLYYGLKKFMEFVDESQENIEDSDLAGCRILVAEDNDLNWEILKEILSDYGLELDWAENGQICLDKFQNSEPGYYQAVLMDVRMPVMGGYDATKNIRALQRPDAQKIPIIAMTADAFSEDIKKCLDCGMNAHTAKPINIEELLSMLKKFILNS